jgi:hypothetical protein
MNVYKYDEKTKEFIGTEEALLDPLETELQGENVYLLPANATFTAPTEPQDGYVNVWNGEAWEQVKDNRGVEYWLPEDKFGAPAREMKELGVLPEGATLTPPEQTQEEKNQAQANEAKSKLNNLAITAMMAQLAGSDISAQQTEYQSNIAVLSDDVALLIPEVYPAWSSNGVEYKKDMRVTYNSILYKVLQNHTSQEGWTPTSAPSLFAKVLTSEGEILDWEQPSSTNPYMKGDKVKFNGKIYESVIDNNVWSPEAYPQGWKEVEE